MYRILLCFGVIGLLLACKPTTDPPLAPSISPIPTLASAAGAVSMPTTGSRIISFETLALNESGADIKASETSKEPQLQVVNDAEQAMALESMVRPEDFRRLLAVDYENYAVVALFRGWQGSSNYQIVIQQISRTGDQLIISADLWEPSPYYASTAELTYPYHLITIARKDLPSNQISLQLESTMITPTPPAK